MRSRCVTQSLALALVCAFFGFCYAVTSDFSEPVLGARAVGSNVALRFSNPPVTGFADEFDLGDAALGSTITRYVTAVGGVRPYRFTSEGERSLAQVIAGLNSTLQLGLSGVLAGSLPGFLPPDSNNPDPLYQTVTGTPGLRFQVTVRDAKGTSGAQRSGFFNLFLFAVGVNDFRFSVDTVPTALKGAPYIARLDTLGGTGTKTFSLVSLSGATQEELGVFVTSEGSLVGRPLRTGTFTFTVRAVDSTGRVANNRQNSAIDQAVTLVVEDYPITTSDLVTLSCTAKGDTAKNNVDSLSFKGQANLVGVTTLLNSDFQFRLDGVAVTGRLDANGKFNDVLPGNQKVKVSVSLDTGLVDVKISKGTFGAALNAANLPVPLARKPILLVIGDAVATSEVLEFASDVVGTRYALNYKLGRTGTSPAGAFQVTSVKGKDGQTIGGQTGDSWKVGFIAIPATGISVDAGLDNVTLATVRIGDNFVQPMPGIVSKGLNTKFSDRSGTGVRKFSLNGKRFKGSVDTFVLSTKTTGIPVAADAVGKGQGYFPLGVDLTRAFGIPFSGEYSRRIFPSNTQYKDREKR